MSLILILAATTTLTAPPARIDASAVAQRPNYAWAYSCLLTAQADLDNYAGETKGQYTAARAISDLQDAEQKVQALIPPTATPQADVKAGRPPKGHDSPLKDAETAVQNALTEANKADLNPAIQPEKSDAVAAIQKAQAAIEGLPEPKR